MVHGTSEGTMIRVKYNNRNTFEDVNFSRNGNLVTMTPTTSNPVASPHGSRTERHS